MIRMTPEKIIDHLRASGFEAFIVGGAVRDMLTGATPAEIDVATDATPDEVAGVFTDMLCGDALGSKNPLLRLAGYLHDIGKPNVCADSPKGITFYDHDKASATLCAERLKSLKFSIDETEYVTVLIRRHMFQFRTKMQPAPVRRLIGKLERVGVPVPYRDLLRLHIADVRANLARTPYTLSELKQLLAVFKTEAERKGRASIANELAINGHDVMQTLGIVPGKLVGEVLNGLLQLVEEDPSLNTKEALLELCKHALKQGGTQRCSM